jgi:hypothetical protein
MADDLTFSYRNARSTAIMSAIAAVVVIESIAVHFAVAARHPHIAWALTLTSVAALVWLVRDYRALGSGAVRLENDTLHLRVGRRFDITLPLARITSAFRPTFRDLPAPGTNQGRDYLNLTKPAAPNVLVVLDAPQRVRLAAGLHREVRRVALRLDEPEAFLRAIAQQCAAMAARLA